MRDPRQCDALQQSLKRFLRVGDGGDADRADLIQTFGSAAALWAGIAESRGEQSFLPFPESRSRACCIASRVR